MQLEPLPPDMQRALDMVQDAYAKHLAENPAPLPQGLRPGPLTEADVRRIVREEIAHAMAIHLQGEAARRG